MSEGVSCTECGHSGGWDEFQDSENDAPDLVYACECPNCGHFWDAEDD